MNFGKYDLPERSKVLAAVGKLQGWPLWEQARGCPVLDTASSSHLYSRPATGHSWAHQWNWLCLWENIIQTVQTAAQHWGLRKERCEKQPCERTHQGQRRKTGRMCSSYEGRDFPATHRRFGRHHSGASKRRCKSPWCKQEFPFSPGTEWWWSKWPFPEGTADSWRGPPLEQGQAWGGRSGRELLWTDCNTPLLIPLCLQVLERKGEGGQGRRVGNEVEPEVKGVVVF